MPRLQRNLWGLRIEGFYKGGWGKVADAFIANFRDRGEIGASLCVRIKGDVKVDLWGGWADESAGTPWREDTLTVVFSCTKGATAFCVHLLADRSKLDIDAPVAAYWPEFAQNGKEDATVAMLLNHSVGVPGFREPLKERAFSDWDYMVRRLEAEPPFWVPGTRHGYHPLTFGWTVGEVVRRVSGQTLGSYFAHEVAKPLGLDFWIGLPEALEPRVAPVIAHVPSADEAIPEFAQIAASEPTSPTACAVMNTGGYLAVEDGVYAPNTRWAHAAEIGASGAVTNARGLAGMYDPLANGGGKVLSRLQVAKMGRISTSTMRDAVLLMPTRFTLGFMASMDNRCRTLGGIESAVLGERAFGHAGVGGSIGFADPECGLAFGYAMNSLGPSILLNARGQSLVDATYKCLGYRGSIAGAWLK